MLDWQVPVWLGEMGATLSDPAVVQAVRLTMGLSLVCGAVALVVGFLLGFLTLVPGVRWGVRAYVELFRNTPLLVQLYFYYWGLPALGIKLDPLVCGGLALSLYSGAYLTEVFRSGLLAIKNEQREAGKALGLSGFQVYGWVVVPQAIRMIFPALANQLVALIKNSSLVSFIGISDVFFQVYKGAVDYFEPVRYFLVGAFIYSVLTLVVASAMQWLDQLIRSKRARFPVLITARDRAALVPEGGLA